jgi:DNA-binding response OmpR family regulator
MEPAKILLVEDEPQLQLVLARTLEQIGYRVATAGTEASAVQAVLQEQPDVLVLDNNLPDGTGWGVLRRLTSQGITCASLPTIMMSAGAPASRRVAELRPQAFLPKPFPIDALKRLIVEALAGRAALESASLEAPGG